MQIGDKVKHRMEFWAAPQRQHKAVSPRCSLKLIPVRAHFFCRHNKTLETCDRKNRNRVNWLSDDVNWNECNLQSYVYWINIYFLHLSGFTKYFFRLVTFMDQVYYSTQPFSLFHDREECTPLWYVVPMCLFHDTAYLLWFDSVVDCISLTGSILGHVGSPVTAIFMWT